MGLGAHGGEDGGCEVIFDGIGGCVCGALRVGEEKGMGRKGMGMGKGSGG